MYRGNWPLLVHVVCVIAATQLGISNSQDFFGVDEQIIDTQFAVFTGVCFVVVLIGVLILCLCPKKKQEVLPFDEAPPEFDQLRLALIEALKSINIENIEQAIQKYVEYCDQDEDVAPDDRLLKEAEQALDAHRQALKGIGDVHEVLKKDLKESVETRRVSAVRESANTYEEFVHEFREKVEPDRELLFEAKKILAKEDGATCVTKLTEAIVKKDVSYIRKTLPEYEKLLEDFHSYNIVTPNKKVIHDATHELHEFEKASKHSESLRHELEKSVDTNDVTHIEKALKKYTEFLNSCGYKINADQYLIEKAGYIVDARHSADETLQCEFAKSTGDLAAALKTHRLTKISNALVTYEEFVQGHKEVHPDQKLVSDAKKTVHDIQTKQYLLAKQEDELKTKLEEAIEQNSTVPSTTPLKTALQKYEEFSEKHKDIFKANTNLVEIAKKLLHEKEDQVTTLSKEHEQRKARLLSAAASNQLAALRSSLTDYEKFIKEHSTQITGDSALVKRMKEKIVQKERELTHVQKENVNLKKNLEKANASKVHATILEELNKYELFARQNGGNVDIDNSVIQKAKDIVKDMDQKMRENLDRHNTVKHALEDAMKGQKLDEMRTALANYEQFGKTNAKLYDLALVKRGKDAIKSRENEAVQLKRKSSVMKRDIKSATTSRNMAAIEEKLAIYQDFAESNSDVIQLDSEIVQKSRDIVEELKNLAVRAQEEFSALKDKVLKTIQLQNIDDMKTALADYQAFVRDNASFADKNDVVVHQATAVIKKREAECAAINTERDRLVKDLEIAVSSNNQAAIVTKLAAYQEYVRKNSRDISLNNEMITEARAKMEVIDEKSKEATSKVGVLRGNLEMAIQSRKLADMKSAMEKYEEFMNNYKDFVDPDESLMKTAKDAIEKRELNLGIVREEDASLRKEMEAAYATNKKSVIQLKISKYEEYSQMHQGDLVLDIELLDKCKARVREIEVKTRLAAEGYATAKRKLAEAIKSSKLVDMKEMLAAYREFVATNAAFVDKDQTIVQEAEEAIKRRENEVEGLSKEHDKLLSGLDKAVKARNKEELDERISLYDEFVRSHFSDVPPNKELLNSAKALAEEIDQNARRAFKECCTLEQAITTAMTSLNVEDMKGALARYQAFTAANVGVVDSDQTVINKALQAIQKREHEIENLQKKHVALKRDIEKALTSGHKSAIDEKIAKYKEFLEKNSGAFEMDNDLLGRCKTAIEDLKVAAVKISEEHDSLRDRLKVAVKDLNLEVMKSLLLEYEKFTTINSENIHTDFNLLKQAKDSIKKRQVELDRIVKENDFLVSDLKKANDSHEKTAIETALASYETFVKKHHGDVAVDNDLIKHSNNMLKEIAQVNEKVVEEHKVLKEKLRTAKATLDEPTIDAAVAEYEEFLKRNKGKVFADRSLLVDAKNTVLALHKKVSLTKAADVMDLKYLNKVIGEVERKGLEPWVKPELEKARKVRDGLENIHQLKLVILNLDRAKMMEMRDYSHPPKAVHEVMVAALLLLGDPESVTRDWGACQKLCSSIRTHDYPGLLKRMRDHDFGLLHPEIAARGEEILKNHNKDEVYTISHGAYNFYVWASGMCDLCLSLVAEKPKPATGTRQKNLLAAMVKELSLLETSATPSPTR